MDARSRELWGKTRASGYWSFVVGRGVFSFGTSFALILLMILEWLKLIPTGLQHPITVMTLMGLAGGLGWGIGVWRLMERQYSSDESASHEQARRS